MGDPTHLRRLRAGRWRVAHEDGLLQGGVGSPMKMGSYRDGADGTAAISRA